MASVCYQNTGKPAGDLPCDPNANVSACCGAGSVCVQNLYCFDNFGDNVPGTCTDSNWGTNPDPACPCPPRKLCKRVKLFSLTFAIQTTLEMPPSTIKMVSHSATMAATAVVCQTQIVARKGWEIRSLNTEIQQRYPHLAQP
jgi:hypothetical protein